MKIAAIIPAYNEEKSISEVVRAAKNNNNIDEVIVVDDGSSDATAAIAQDGGARVIKMRDNQGKGEALKRGVYATNADILLFLDADLVGLVSKHLSMLLEPVIKGEADMTVGAIDRKMFGIFLNEWLRRTESPFSGMRVIKRDFWEEVPDKYKKKFYVESVITYLAKKSKTRTRPFVLEGVRHIVKEKKMGTCKGSIARWKMNWQIVLINFVLRLTRLEVSKKHKNQEKDVSNWAKG